MVVSKEGFSRTAMEVVAQQGDQSGKVFLITGAYSGIGVETTKALLSVQGHVILAGRSTESMKTFVDQLVTTDGCDASLIDGEGPACDLSDLTTVKAFGDYVVQKYTQLDVVILNAGVMMTPPGVTKQGYETQVGINVVGHFLLAHKLASLTRRQVWVSSHAHRMSGAGRFDFEAFSSFQLDEDHVKNYDKMKAYQQSKLGNILLSKEFSKRFSNTDGNDITTLEAVSLHPGVITTNLGRHLPGYVSRVFSVITWVGIISKKTVEQGAATTVTCATLPSDALKNGAYYEDCVVGQEAGNATNEEDAIRLYDLCDELTKEFQ